MLSFTMGELPSWSTVKGRGITKDCLRAPEVVEEALRHAGTLGGPPPHHPNLGKMRSQLGSLCHCRLVLFFSHSCLSRCFTDILSYNGFSLRLTLWQALGAKVASYIAGGL